MPASPRARWTLLVLAATCCFGTLGTFSRLFFDAGGDAYTLLVARFLVVSTLLGVAALLLGQWWTARGAVAPTLVLGGFQLGVAYALLEGFARAPVALVSLLFFSYPLLTAVGAVPVFGERLDRLRLAVIAVAVAGIVLTVGVPEAGTWLGIVLGLVAAVCVAFLILGSRLLMGRTELAPVALCSLMFASPALVLLLVWPLRSPGFGSLSGEAWAWLACGVLISATVPLAVFYTGVTRIEAGAAGLLSCCEPLVSVVLATVVLGETLGPTRIAGGLLIVVAVTAVALAGARPRPLANAADA
ncbi:MAG: DMT family transporter [Gaiella sp.]